MGSYELATISIDTQSSFTVILFKFDVLDYRFIHVVWQWFYLKALPLLVIASVT